MEWKFAEVSRELGDFLLQAGTLLALLIDLISKNATFFSLLLTFIFLQLVQSLPSLTTPVLTLFTSFKSGQRFLRRRGQFRVDIFASFQRVFR